ncbi:MAG: BglG family transcription antiterminator [Clostridiales bacterium]|jgi:transcriptional antiterminator/mannitol/fructose-specific phosphotransferase system IIA component (Ntr-type)|nr:BglG family transcription antiterminator [Clostridiales bacterium]
MELNKRCMEILRYLIEKDDFVKTEELVEIYKLTDRAIRYNTDKIEAFLVKNGFKYFERQYNKGIMLIKDEKLEEFLKGFINADTDISRYQYVYSKDERMKFIATKLLQASQPINISYFQGKLSLSKNTILKELDLLGKWLNDRGLELIRKPKLGILINGKEADKRRIITELVSETISSEDILSYASKKLALTKINNLQFDILFSDINLDFLDSLIRTAETELERKFSDEAYGGLITHLAIMIKRIQLNKEIYLPDVDMEIIRQGIEYKVAQVITSKIEENFSIKIPETETRYIALHLLGAKVLKNNEQFINGRASLDGLFTIATLMTEEIERIYEVDFGSAKDNIIQGLVIHLRPTIYRIRYNLKLSNPIYDEIRASYNELFLNTKIVAFHLEHYIKHEIDDQEVSYITLHFGAALENARAVTRDKPKIVIVCGTGIGTAKMVASKIASEFDVQIVDTISCREIGIITEEYNYIISTVEIPDYDPKKYIRINPLLLEKDYIKLGQYLKFKYDRTANHYNKLKLVNRLIDIAEKYVKIPDRKFLQYEFLYELNKTNDFETEGRYIYMLNSLLTWGTIKVNADCDNWIGAIKLGTDLLIENGCVEDRYYDAIINNFKEFGPYMVVAPGIVLSHARPENGVNKLSMSLITLKNPIEFGNKSNDPVKLIITLAASDNETHLKALSQLMDLFMNSEDMTQIFKASNKEDVIDIINKYSK